MSLKHAVASTTRMKTGLVLAGGAARGAWEAGVVSYLRDELPRRTGAHVPIDILTGASVGAINACFMAGTQDDPGNQGRRFVDTWRELRLEDVLRFGVGDIFRVFREALGKKPVRWGRGRHGGLVNPVGLEAFVGRKIPWLQIGRNIRAGIVQGLAVTATHVVSGRSQVFVQRPQGGVPGWSQDEHVAAGSARIGPKHALASAAIPVLFPAVSVGGQMYVDGGLRHNVPLSPALRLGAQRVIVLSLRHVPEAEGGHLDEITTEELEHKAGSAPFLVGKALNALMLDHTDADLNRLRRLNGLLEAGTSAYGGSFTGVLNTALLPSRKQPLRYVRNILLRPSRDLGSVAGEYLRSAEFRRRANGLAGRWMLRLADSDGEGDSDLASYLLFDGGYADRLIDLGRSDARRVEAEWLRFLSVEPHCDAEGAYFDEVARASG